MALGFSRLSAKTQGTDGGSIAGGVEGVFLWGGGGQEVIQQVYLLSHIRGSLLGGWLTCGGLTHAGKTNSRQRAASYRTSDRPQPLT